MVLIPSNLTSTLTLNTQSAVANTRGLSLGQILEANIQPNKGGEVKLTIGDQTFTAKTKEPITESGRVLVRVKQLTPEIQLSIVKNPTPESKNGAAQQIVQSAYRQFIPTQAPISQTFQQINLMQSLPPSLQQPIQSLLSQIAKQEGIQDGKALKERFNNSGLFLESKIKNTSSSAEVANLKKDIKAQLLQLQQQTDKMQLSQPANKQLSALSQLLNQAISRITVQQIQLYENPYISSLQLPNEKTDNSGDDSIEIRKSENESDNFWEVYVDLSLPSGKLSGKLKLTEDNDLNLFIWCENDALQELIGSKLNKLKENLEHQGFRSVQIQLVPAKPEKTSVSVKVALIDIKV